MRMNLIAGGLLLLLPILTNAQRHESSYRFELNQYTFDGRLIDIDPTPDWKGYYLDNEQDAFAVNLTKGIVLKDVLFLGTGLGYQNFEGHHGFAVFAHGEISTRDERIKPLAIFRSGYSHLWNQYEKGTGTFMAEISVGLELNIQNGIRLIPGVGLVFMQQSRLLAVKIAFAFP